MDTAVRAQRLQRYREIGFLGRAMRDEAAYVPRHPRRLDGRVRHEHVDGADRIVPMPIPRADRSPPGNESRDIGFPGARRQEDRLVRRARLAPDPQYVPGTPDTTDAP